jgi:NADPH2:quinone reductase
MVRAGRAPNPARAPALPAILGNGVGGEVDGRRVVTTTGGSGGYAERVAVDEAGLIGIPDGLGTREAVALLADGRTAMALAAAAAIQPGETVLVEAAAGGVGSLLVQLARRAGARVVAAAGGGRKLEVARELGADVAVDYTRPGWTDGLDGADVVFDGVGGEVARAAFSLLRAGGRLCSYGLASGTFADVTGAEAAERNATLIRGLRLSPAEMSELSRAALAEAAAGRLRPVIGQTFPLARAADAHAAIESRATIGKTLLTTSPA